MSWWKAQPAVVVWALLWSSTAGAATTWWVADAPTAQALDDELALVWPDNDVHVVVGSPSGSGVWWAEGGLHYVSGDMVREQAVGDALSVQVLLVRSWSTRVDSEPVWTPSPAPRVELPARAYSPLVELDERPERPEIPRVALLPGPFPRIELGGGVQAVEPLGEGLDGGRLMARFHFGALALETSVGLSVGVGRRADNAFVLDPVDAGKRRWDTLGGGLAVSFGLPVELRPAAAFWVAPRAVVGLDVRRTVGFRPALDDSLRQTGAGMAAGPSLGITTDLWWRDRLGVRLGLFERIDVLEPSLDGFVVSADLLFAL